MSGIPNQETTVNGWRIGYQTIRQWKSGERLPPQGVTTYRTMAWAMDRVSDVDPDNNPAFPGEGATPEASEQIAFASAVRWCEIWKHHFLKQELARAERDAITSVVAARQNGESGEP